MNTIRGLKRFDPDRDLCSVGSDLGLFYLKILKIKQKSPLARKVSKQLFQLAYSQLT